MEAKLKEKMEAEQYGSMTRSLLWEGKVCSEDKQRCATVYGDCFSSMATVKNRFNEFETLLLNLMLRKRLTRQIT